MLDILFLNLHRRYLNIEPTHGGFLGIYLLAAFTRSEGFESKSFAGSLERGKRYLDELCNAEAVSMIGLYCDYENVTENIFLSRYIKDQFKIPVIVGGPQATALDEEFFRKSKCDAVVRFEGELTVLELMNFFLEDVGKLEKIHGISYLTSEGIQTNPDRKSIRNLDVLPFINEDCYLEPKQFYRGLSLMTGRGCPFHCAFCHEGSHTRAVRFRSVENILAEIDAYLEKWNGDDLTILFTDDTFTLDLTRVKEICVGLAERRKSYRFKWFCEGHVHTLFRNPEMIRDLAMGGCYRIQLGIEAGTSKVLQSYGKHSTPEEIFEVVKMCRDACIEQIFGNIILGGAHFSREIFEEDKKFAHDLIVESRGTVEIGTVTFWPLAETRMTRSPEDFGIKIIDPEFVTSAGDFPQIETTEIDRFEINEMERELREFIEKQMLDMIATWQIPTSRILSWFKNAHRYRGMWFATLRRDEILFSYYEMLSIGEGFHSSQIEDLSSAHPMRVIALNLNLYRESKSSIKIHGESFVGIEIEIILLTTGKLSVKEIAEHLDLTIDQVIEFLNQLEDMHLIVYSKY